MTKNQKTTKVRSKAVNMILVILKWLGVVLGVLLGAGIVYLLTQVNLSNPKDLAAFLRRKIEKAGYPGISVAIIHDGQLTATATAGYADVENNIPVADDTLFSIASVSKTVTGVAVMQLVEQGLIGLDDDINLYLPFAVVNPNFPDAKITFRMLLSHTGGIGNNYPEYDALYTFHSGGGDSPISLEEFLRGFLLPDGQWYNVDKIYSKTMPGTKYAYSNVGYALLGYLVQQASGMDFADYCKQHIFEPLDMPETTWMLRDTNLEKLAVPYDGNNQPMPHYSFPSYPDGAIRTTPTEFSHFVIAMLNGGTYNGVSILKPETVALMFTPIADDGKQGLAFAYGVLADIYMPHLDHADIAGHSGGDEGILSFMLMNRNKGNGLIVFMNKTAALNPRVLNLILMMGRLVSEANLR